MEIILGLLLLLVATRIFAEGAERLRIPSSVGELAAGIFLAAAIVLVGPYLPVLEEVAGSPELQLVAQAGIFFLVLRAGIDMRPQEIASQSAKSFAVAVGGALVPLVAGSAIAWVLLPPSDLRYVQAFAAGVVLSITSIPAALRVLGEFDLLHRPIGRVVVGAAIFDDVIGLFLLAMLTSVMGESGLPDLREMAWLALKVAIFFGLTLTLGARVYPHISLRLGAVKMAAAEFSALMVAALAYALFAELMGLHWVLGAFVAGLFFEPGRVGAKPYEEVQLTVGAITDGFLGPLFFASIGLLVEFHTLVETPVLLACLVGAGMIGKLIGAGGVARISGFSSRDAVAIGTGMSARGAVELIVISVAVSNNVFPVSGDTIAGNMVSALILTTVLSTLLSPIFLRLVLARGSQAPTS